MLNNININYTSIIISSESKLRITAVPQWSPDFLAFPKTDVRPIYRKMIAHFWYILLKLRIIVCSRTAARFSRVRHHDTHDAANGGGGEEITDVQQCAERHQSRRLGLCYGGRHVLRGFRQLVRTQWLPPLRLERGKCSVDNRQRMRGLTTDPREIE